MLLVGRRALSQGKGSIFGYIFRGHLVGKQSRVVELPSLIGQSVDQLQRRCLIRPRLERFL